MSNEIEIDKIKSNNIEKENKMTNNIEIDKIMTNKVDKDKTMSNKIEIDKIMTNNIEKERKMSKDVEKDKDVMTNNIEKERKMSKDVEKDKDNMSNNIEKENKMSNNVELTNENTQSTYNTDVAENVEICQNGETDRKSESEEGASAKKEEGNPLGKFKDAESLLKAYNSLQSEFTKRCQRVKELETELSEKESETAKNASANMGEDTTPKEISETQKEEILKEYLRGVLGGKKKAIVLSGEGVGVKTPTVKPKTLSEAGDVAIRLFTEKN